MKWWRRKEDGVETAAMLIVLPLLVILVFALIDIAVMFTTRSQVAAVARDTVRSAAADGGNLNPKTTTTKKAWDSVGKTQLYSSGKCNYGRCQSGKKPTMDCSKITSVSSGTTYTAQVAKNTGDLITCTITYPYEGLNQGLLDSPMGLGFGTFLQPFTVSASSRAETGTNG